jgi:hypothetical protein
MTQSSLESVASPTTGRLSPPPPVGSPERAKPVSRQRKASVAAVALLPYLWFLITTPYNRFSILATIHLERILVVVILASAVLVARLHPRFPLLSRFLLAMFGIELLSYLTSNYAQVAPASWWISEYWKLMVFHFLFVWILSSMEDVKCILKGHAIISLLYQLHSWSDFVRGGSYVYQQGFRRLVGVWDSGGAGAGNAMGSLAVFTLPFVTFCYRDSTNALSRAVFWSSHGLCLLSVIFSGTRAALACSLVYACYVFLELRSSKKVTLLLGFVAVLILGSLTLPEDYWRRQTGWLLGSYDETSAAERLARRTASSRIEGLVDGFTLARANPILGTGPGTSAMARAVLRGDTRAIAALKTEIDPPNAPLQLHNLYGQIVAETGFIGFGIFITMIAVAWICATRLVRRAAKLRSNPEAVRVANVGRMLKAALVVLTCYGMFSHTLYDYRWLLIIGLLAAWYRIGPRVIADDTPGK